MTNSIDAWYNSWDGFWVPQLSPTVRKLVERELFEVFWTFMQQFSECLGRFSFLLAQDSNESQLEACIENHRHLRVSVESHLADASKEYGLPFPNCSVDKVLTAPPWDRQFKAVGGLEVFYSKILREVQRVLRPNGTMALLLNLPALQVFDPLLKNWRKKRCRFAVTRHTVGVLLLARRDQEPWMCESWRKDWRTLRGLWTKQRADERPGLRPAQERATKRKHLRSWGVMTAVWGVVKTLWHQKWSRMMGGKPESIEILTVGDPKCFGLDYWKILQSMQSLAFWSCEDSFKGFERAIVVRGVSLFEKISWSAESFSSPAQDIWLLSCQRDCCWTLKVWGSWWDVKIKWSLFKHGYWLDIRARSQGETQVTKLAALITHKQAIAHIVSAFSRNDFVASLLPCPTLIMSTIQMMRRRLWQVWPKRSRQLPDTAVSQSPSREKLWLPWYKQNNVDGWRRDNPYLLLLHVPGAAFRRAASVTSVKGPCAQPATGLLGNVSIASKNKWAVRKERHDSMGHFCWRTCPRKGALAVAWGRVWTQPLQHCRLLSRLGMWFEGCWDETWGLTPAWLYVVATRMNDQLILPLL